MVAKTERTTSGRTSRGRTVARRDYFACSVCILTGHLQRRADEQRAGETRDAIRTIDTQHRVRRRSRELVVSRMTGTRDRVPYVRGTGAGSHWTCIVLRERTVHDESSPPRRTTDCKKKTAFRASSSPDVAPMSYGRRRVRRYRSRSSRDRFRDLKVVGQEFSIIHSVVTSEHGGPGASIPHACVTPFVYACVRRAAVFYRSSSRRRPLRTFRIRSGRDVDLYAAAPSCFCAF